MKLALFIACALLVLLGLLIVLTTEYLGSGIILTLAALIGAVATDPAQTGRWQDFCDHMDGQHDQ